MGIDYFYWSGLALKNQWFSVYLLCVFCKVACYRFTKDTDVQQFFLANRLLKCRLFILQNVSRKSRRYECGFICLQKFFVIQ